MDKPNTPAPIGYGSPPQAHQFKRGQSGNPSGRPKGSTSLAREITKVAREHVVINEHGRQRKVTKLQAISKSIVHAALKGDLAAARLTLTLLQMEHDGVTAAHTKDALSESDQTLVKQLLNRLPTINEEAGHEPDKT